jgi:hypothetical protein
MLGRTRFVLRPLTKSMVAKVVARLAQAEWLGTFHPRGQTGS